MPSSISVWFRIRRYPDGNGLYIRSQRPVGIYTASRNPEAAAWYFEFLAQLFVLEIGLLKPGKGERVGFERPIDWEKFTLFGCGVGVLGIHEVCRYEVAGGSSGPPVELDHHVCCDLLTDKVTMVYAHDIGIGRKKIDRWLFKTMTADATRMSAY